MPLKIRFSEAGAPISDLCPLFRAPHVQAPQFFSYPRRRTPNFDSLSIEDITLCFILTFRKNQQPWSGTAPNNAVDPKKARKPLLDACIARCFREMAVPTSG
jgi:hypothetical protein